MVLEPFLFEVAMNRRQFLLGECWGCDICSLLHPCFVNCCEKSLVLCMDETLLALLQMMQLLLKDEASGNHIIENNSFMSRPLCMREGATVHCSK